MDPYRDLMERIVPMPYAGATIADFSPYEAHFEDPTPFQRERWTRGLDIVIYGPVGVGKTHLAAAMVRYCLEAQWVIENWGRIAWATEADLLRIGPEAAMAYDRARAASLLVIDDLGVEKVGAWAAARMTQLIDARVSIRPTIITTNLSAPEVREVSVRIADRLRTFEVVRMIGESKRGRTEGRR